MVVKRMTAEQAAQALARAVELARENDELLEGSDGGPSDEPGTSQEPAAERGVDEQA
jgi:hypothetical protein